MTPDRFYACMEILHWSMRSLATQVNVDEKQLRRWLNTRTIPPELAAWLDRRARQALATPPPRLETPRGRPPAPPA